MVEVDSSHVSRIGYSPPDQELWVDWDTGKTSVYQGVPPKLAANVMTSWSVGQALRTDIKGHYEHRYAE
jgi:hypothetical protein